jgi:ADP-ribose pyrophosphatase YjhB (NUDIX family)
MIEQRNDFGEKISGRIENILKVLTQQDIDGDAELENTDDYKIREAARAVVFDNDGRVALLHAQKTDYYKLPGGGIEAGEDKMTGLDRELKEEIGSKITVEGEVGSVVEFRKAYKRQQISYCYFGSIDGEKGEPDFTDSENAEQFKIVWADNLDKATELVHSGDFKTDKYDQQFIAKRDEIFLKEMKKIIDEGVLIGGQNEV